MKTGQVILSLGITWISWFLSVIYSTSSLFLFGTLFGPIYLILKFNQSIEYKFTGLTLKNIGWSIGLPLVLVGMTRWIYYCKIDKWTYKECTILYNSSLIQSSLEFFLGFILNFPVCLIQEVLLRSCMLWYMEHGTVDSLKSDSKEPEYLPVNAGIILGMIQSLWHLPLFFLVKPHFAGNPYTLSFWGIFLGFSWLLCNQSVYLTYIFNITGTTDYSLASSRSNHKKDRYPHENSWDKVILTSLMYTSLSTMLSIDGIEEIRFYPWLLGNFYGILAIWLNVTERGGWLNLASPRIFYKDVIMKSE